MDNPKLFRLSKCFYDLAKERHQLFFSHRNSILESSSFTIFINEIDFVLFVDQLVKLDDVRVFKA
jgi:hypothetical protein